MKTTTPPSIVIERRPDLLSNHRHDLPFVVQVWCSCIGWADSIYGGDHLASATYKAHQLAADESHWVHPAAPRQLRIVQRRAP